MAKLSVPLESDLHRRLRLKAFDEDRPMAELVREALEGYLGNGRVPVAAESRSTGRPPEPPVLVGAALRREAEASAALDGETQVVGPASKDERLAKARAAQESVEAGDESAGDPSCKHGDKKRVGPFLVCKCGYRERRP